MILSAEKQKFFKDSVVSLLANNGFDIVHVDLTNKSNTETICFTINLINLSRTEESRAEISFSITIFGLYEVESDTFSLSKEVLRYGDDSISREHPPLEEHLMAVLGTLARNCVADD